ncbi:MAG TPA: LCCL domain-containing protein [Allosphingosinicella sp.]
MLRSLSFTAGIAAAVAAGLAFASGPAPALAQNPGGPAARTCPDRLTGIDSLVCNCPSEATAGGSVWGNDIYTDDSAICRAALHAGAIGTDGGLVWVHAAPGQAAYPAVTRNSVASGQWGQWRRSITFDPVEDADKQGFASVCPGSAVGLPQGPLRCTCSAEATASGLTVWGSDPYTSDSAICRAAVHAGVIGPGGGEVSVNIGAGAGVFPGSARNGVSTSTWGGYPTGFTFDR